MAEVRAPQTADQITCRCEGHIWGSRVFLNVFMMFGSLDSHNQSPSIVAQQRLDIQSMCAGRSGSMSRSSVREHNLNPAVLRLAHIVTSVNRRLVLRTPGQGHGTGGHAACDQLIGDTIGACL